MIEKKTPTMPARMPGRLCALSFGLLALLLSSGSLAQPEDRQWEPPPEPPPLPARMEIDEGVEPAVTIVPGKERTVHEYRIHGKLYAVKIIPKNGRPYYLVDTDGDGRLEQPEDELTDEFLVPQWVLHSW